MSQWLKIEDDMQGEGLNGIKCFYKKSLKVIYTVLLFETSCMSFVLIQE
jgi:hypothetical protein